MKFKPYHLLFVAFFVAASSCTKAPGPVLNLAITAPSSVQVALNNSTMTATWKYTGAKPPAGFIAQLSLNSNFKPVLYTDTLSATTMTVSYDNVGNITEAYFRVMAMAPNIAQNSPFVVAKFSK